MGFVFVLDRATGRPVFPVMERPAPSSDVPGEHASLTQPIPSAPPPLVPQRLGPDDAWGLTFVDQLLCRRQIAQLRSDGLYTPPSLRGSIVFPFTGGGVNWGGGAFDREDGLFIVNAMSLAHVVRLIPRVDYAAAHAAAPNAEIGPGLGTPYAVERTLLTSIFGIPCNAPPWGTLTAVELTSGTFRWQIPLGSMAMGFIRGLPNLGGPDRHRDWTGIHCRLTRRQVARLRRLDRQGTLASVVAGRRSGNADELRRRWSAVRRHRCWRPLQTGQHARRRRHRFLSAARHR